MDGARAGKGDGKVRRGLDRFAIIATRALPPILMGAAAYVLWRELRHLSLADLTASMRGWGPPRVIAAFGFAALTYLLLGLNEFLSLRWLGSGLPYRRVAPVSFVAYAFGNTIGFNLLVATAIRARAYQRDGVPITTTAAASVWDSQMFWTGMAGLAGLSLIRSEHGAMRAGGVALLCVPVAVVALCAVLRRPISLMKREWRLPPPAMAAAQIVIAMTLNLSLAAVLWTLIGGGVAGYLGFAGAYTASLAAGLVSGAPGGIGVFETAMLTLLPDLARADLAAAFLGYRLAYFLIPLIIAAGLFVAREQLWKRRQKPELA